MAFLETYWPHVDVCYQKIYQTILVYNDVLSVLMMLVEQPGRTLKELLMLEYYLIDTKPAISPSGMEDQIEGRAVGKFILPTTVYYI